MTLETGDYALLIDGQLGTTRIERKSKGDLFLSFKGDNYRREKEKIERAKSLGLLYILAVEATAEDVWTGHGYYKRGEWVPCKKPGSAQLRQLMTIQHRYQLPVWFCHGRNDMALRVKEFLLAEVRANAKY